MLQENFVSEIAGAIRKFWNRPALSDYQGATATYSQIADRILWLHTIFEKSHIKSGDKIAVLGRNSRNWGIVYFAAVTYGAVIVPIMPDFHADDVHHIVNHSESSLLFADSSLYEALEDEKMKHLDGIFFSGTV